jgi:hypothetical protein
MQSTEGVKPAGVSNQPWRLRHAPVKAVWWDRRLAGPVWFCLDRRDAGATGNQTVSAGWRKRRELSDGRRSVASGRGAVAGVASGPPGRRGSARAAEADAGVVGRSFASKLCRRGLV